MKGVCERQLSEFARSSIHERASAEDRRDGRTTVDGAKVSGTVERRRFCFFPPYPRLTLHCSPAAYLRQ